MVRSIDLGVCGDGSEETKLWMGHGNRVTDGKVVAGELFDRFPDGQIARAFQPERLCREAFNVQLELIGVHQFDGSESDTF